MCVTKNTESSISIVNFMPVWPVDVKYVALELSIGRTDRLFMADEWNRLLVYNQGYNHLTHTHTHTTTHTHNHISQWEISTKEKGSPCSPELWQTLFTLPFDKKSFILSGFKGNVGKHTQIHTLPLELISLQAWLPKINGWLTCEFQLPSRS